MSGIIVTYEIAETPGSLRPFMARRWSGHRCEILEDSRGYATFPSLAVAEAAIVRAIGVTAPCHATGPTPLEALTDGTDWGEPIDEDEVSSALAERYAIQGRAAGGPGPLGR